MDIPKVKKTRPGLSKDIDAGIVIPCYNEASRIDVGLFRSFLVKNINVILLFVNDGSKDNTEEVLNEILNLKNTKLINLDKNYGKATAVQIGVNTLLDENVRYIGFWDADLSTPLSDIKNFIMILNNDKSLSGVIGSRILKLDNNIVYKKKRKLYGRLLMFILYFGPLKNIPVYDSQCGAKLFKKEYAKIIFEKPMLTNWLFDIELLMRLNDLKPVKESILELPLNEWVHRPDSKIGLKDTFDILKDIKTLYSLKNKSL